MTETPGCGPRVRIIRRAESAGDLKDWGPIAPAAIAPAAIAPPATPPPGGPGPATSRTRGALLYKGDGGSPEAGIWECTPGRWQCRVERDEFCHFLAGRSLYTHESGETTEIRGGDIAFFPAGWNGTCEVLETVRKVYMIR